MCFVFSSQSNTQHWSVFVAFFSHLGQYTQVILSNAHHVTNECVPSLRTSIFSRLASCLSCCAPGLVHIVRPVHIAYSNRETRFNVTQQVLTRKCVLDNEVHLIMEKLLQTRWQHKFKYLSLYLTIIEQEVYNNN